MNRKLVVYPAFDKTDPDPKKDYGVGCVEFRFTVEGDLGMVELQLLTQWYLPHVMKRRLNAMKEDVWNGKQDFLLESFMNPNPIDLCYFSPTRLSEDDSFFQEGIPHFRNSEPCYYGYKYMDDKGVVIKDFMFSVFVEKGEEELWKLLEDYYREVFGENGHQ